MANRQQVLKHVEEGAYLARTAQLVAEALADSVRLGDIPAQREHDVLFVALLAELDRRRLLDRVRQEAARYAATLGYRELSRQDEQTVAHGAITSIIAEAAPRLDHALTDVENRLAKMAEHGIATETIAAAVSGDAAGKALFVGVRAILRQTASALISGVQNAILSASQAAVELAS